MAAALENPADIEQIADGLTAAANAMSEGLKDAVRSGKCSQEKAYAVLHDEQMLRNRASSLYFDAVQRTVVGLAVEQGGLAKTIADANEALKRVDDFKRFLTIAADVISLASAIYAGRPDTIVAAAKALQAEVKVG